MNLIGGLTSTATRAAGEENIIEFQRDLETKEMEELYHLIEKARKQLYVVEKEKGQNRKENELFIKRVRELKAYMKEHGLESQTRKKKVEEKRIKFRRKKDMVRSLTLNTDGNNDDQQDEFIEIMGPISEYEAMKIRHFAAQMTEIDRMMQSAESEADMINLKGLALQYEACKQNMIGYAKHIGAGVKKAPVNKAEKEKEKERAKERTEEHDYSRGRTLELKQD